MDKKLAATLITSVILSSTTFPAHAFDFGGMVTGAIKDAVSDVAKDMAKTTAKETAKTAAAAQGIEGADKYIDAAVDNAEGIQNGVATANSLSSASSGGAAWVAANQAIGAAGRINNEENKMAGNFRSEYVAISTKMGQCTDNACISRYQKELMALQAKGDAYVAETGDANFDGNVNQYDSRQAKVNEAMAHLNSCKKSDEACRNKAYEKFQAASYKIEPAADLDD